MNIQTTERNKSHACSWSITKHLKSISGDMCTQKCIECYTFIRFFFVFITNVISPE